jgi:two-component system sensor histidine kinase VicK
VHSETENGRNVIPDGEQEHTNELRRYHIIEQSLLAVEAAKVGTWLFNEATKEFVASNRLKELFGYHADEKMSFENAITQIDAKYREKVVGGLKKAILNREHYHMDFPVTGLHDQQLRWVKALGGVYTEPSGDKSLFSGVMLDITVDKQKELRKNKFIGMVSHELKTPLTSLKAYVQMLFGWAKKQKDSFSEVALTKVEKQIKKMQNMINGFLNVSQAESGKFQLTKVDFDLDELISEVVSETNLITSSHNIEYVPCRPTVVHADRDKIEQVIINLLNNSIKYSAKGTPITLYCDVIDDMAQIRIKDEGFGIAQEDIEKLFTQYYRVENKTTENITGFGIGLYLSAEIIKHHDSLIWVESQVGQGSTFYFNLPLKAETSGQ